MRINTHRIQDYQFKSTNRFFLDANIWLFLFGPQGNSYDKRLGIYSNAYGRLINSKAAIYIDVLVISEFINTYARIEWKSISPADPFKRFRNSSDFKPIASSIAAAIRSILRSCKIIENGVSSLNIGALLAEYETGTSDFNDQVLIEICKANNLIFITDDADFANTGIQLVTANKRLL